MKALLIDGLNLVRRVFSAVPVPGGPANHDEAVMDSVVASINRALTLHAPTHAVGVFDGEGPSWRHQIFPRYKSQTTACSRGAGRTLRPLMVAFEQVAGVKCVKQPGFEADDLLASSAIRVAARGGHVVILSTDTSLCQMLGPRVMVHDHFSGRDLDEAFVRQRFGVEPARLVDLLALTGIQSSSIPGVKGIGPNPPVDCLAIMVIWKTCSRRPRPFPDGLASSSSKDKPTPGFRAASLNWRLMFSWVSISVNSACWPSPDAMLR